LVLYALRVLNATITQRIDITPELIIFRIKPDKAFNQFLPGQYVALGLTGAAPRPAEFPPEHETHAPDKIIKRAYSIGSSPSEKEYVEFYVAIAPQGALTSRLVMLKEGDRIFMTPKITGTFTICDVPESHNLILVSTGTGIAPYMSMLRSPGTWTAGRKITLLHGVRYSSDLAYREELEEFAAKRPSFKYYAIVSRADDSWSGPRGYVQKFFEDGTVKLDAEVDHVFVCGNPAMIDDLEKLLITRGYQVHSKRTPGNLHVEKYW